MRRIAPSRAPQGSDHRPGGCPRAAGAERVVEDIEEPPSASVFLLVTSRPDALLPTVLSRCPRLRFRLVDADDVAAGADEAGAQRSEARATAATADGSVGHALAASGRSSPTRAASPSRVLEQAAVNDDMRRRLDSTKELLAKTGAGGLADREQLAVNLRAMASLLRALSFCNRRDHRACQSGCQPEGRTPGRIPGERGSCAARYSRSGSRGAGAERRCQDGR